MNSKLSLHNQNLLKIKKLREEARNLLIVNNPLIDQLWAIKCKFNEQNLSAEVKDVLKSQENELNKKLEEAHYAEQIHKLKQQIHVLEMETYGHSDILSSSPNASNNLL